ncbi:MAG: TIGR04053 family radical SAM/SPASM domain-containing protein [Gemmatimonadota bacterium]|nr:MAG: TIGR04053 family radical SAM/SPASM domain-containing protein [Gemmatimonadota bacterium]
MVWETTQACDLACKHCRAEARPWRDPDELTTEEGKKLLDDVRRFGPIIFVFSGGDALKRPDIVELVRYGSDLGLRMAATPATTPLATPEIIHELKDAGLARLAVSLDGSCPEIHDEFRQVAGSFEEGIRILKTARAAGMTTQVNTVVAKHNLDDFEALCELMTPLGIVFWEVFLLVPMGRASRGDVASAKEFEVVFERLYELSKTAPFDIKATAAPHYQRVVLERKAAEAAEKAVAAELDPMTSGTAHSYRDGIGRARNVNDGDGFLFVSHTGDIMPSGFLPIAAGNVRSHDLVDTYRTAPIFKKLRDRTLLKGKCGVCEFRDICGGSRARSWAVTGDYLAAEPYCAYIPDAWRDRKKVERTLPMTGAA